MMLFHNMLALLLVISLATDRYSFAAAQIVQVRQAIIPKQPPQKVCSYLCRNYLYDLVCPPALSLPLTNIKYMFISVLYLLLHYSQYDYTVCPEVPTLHCKNGSTCTPGIASFGQHNHLDLQTHDSGEFALLLFQVLYEALVHL